MEPPVTDSVAKTFQLLGDEVVLVCQQHTATPDVLKVVWDSVLGMTVAK